MKQFKGQDIPSWLKGIGMFGEKARYFFKVNQISSEMTKSKKPWKKLFILCIGVAVIIFLISALLIYSGFFAPLASNQNLETTFSGDDFRSSVNPVWTPIIRDDLNITDVKPVWTPIVRDMVREVVTVEVNSHNLYEIFVPENISWAKIDGNFTVAGNNENIKVYVVDEVNLNYWITKKSMSTYYNSSEVSAADVNCMLPSSGVYYLVFDNTYSPMKKILDTQIDLIVQSR